MTRQCCNKHKNLNINELRRIVGFADIACGWRQFFNRWDWFRRLANQPKFSGKYGDWPRIGGQIVNNLATTVKIPYVKHRGIGRWPGAGRTVGYGVGAGRRRWRNSGFAGGGMPARLRRKNALTSIPGRNGKRRDWWVASRFCAASGRNSLETTTMSGGEVRSGVSCP